MVALDAAAAMVQLAREAAPDAWPVRADLEALPFRRGALGSGWARASYLHVATDRLPAALADLHHTLAVGSPVHLCCSRARPSGTLARRRLPGRWFSGWAADSLADVVVGAGFDRRRVRGRRRRAGLARVPATRGRTLPDTVGPGMRLLVCGLNPSVYSADAGHRVRPSRQPLLARGTRRRARQRRPRPARRARCTTGIGMTDLVKRATPRADELTRDEYRAGLGAGRAPGALAASRARCASSGLAGWRAAVDRKAVAGAQPAGIGGRPAYVMPSTSGLNARTPPSRARRPPPAAAAAADGSAVRSGGRARTR